jgi:hypothetical protein
MDFLIAAEFLELDWNTLIMLDKKISLIKSYKGKNIIIGSFLNL